MTKEHPRLKIIRTRNAAGEEVAYYRHSTLGRNYGRDPVRAIALYKRDEAALAKNGQLARAGNSIAAGVDAYKKSDAYLDLADSTQKLWKLYLNDLADNCGVLTSTEFDRQFASEFVSDIRRRRGKGSAKNARRAGSSFWTWAIEFAKYPEFNPFYAPPRSGRKKSTRLKDREEIQPIWREKHIDAFLRATRTVNQGGNPTLVDRKIEAVERVPDSIRLAALLGFYTVQRQGDIRALNAKQLSIGKDGTWRLGAEIGIQLRTSKTHALLTMPVHKNLRSELERLKIKPGADRFLVQNESGGQFSRRHFHRKFRSWIVAAGLDKEKLTFRDFRRSAMVFCAEHGMPTPRIAALSGHSINQTQKILDLYIPKTQRLADGAMRAFETFSTWQVPLPSPLPSDQSPPVRSVRESKTRREFVGIEGVAARPAERRRRGSASKAEQS